MVGRGGGHGAGGDGMVWGGARVRGLVVKRVMVMWDVK